MWEYMADLAITIIPYLAQLAGLLIVLDLFILFPLSFFRKTKNLAGSCIFLSSYIFGINLWMLGCLVTFSLWGKLATLIGFGIMGIGVIPMAMIALAFKGMWSLFLQFIVMGLFTYGARLWGLKVARVE